VRINDLHHNFASLLVSGGMTLPMIGKLLGQTQVQTTQRYPHLLNDPLRAGLQAGRRYAAGEAKNYSKRSVDISFATSSGTFIWSSITAAWPEAATMKTEGPTPAACGSKNRIWRFTSLFKMFNIV
jgi:hypothetical protein